MKIIILNLIILFTIKTYSQNTSSPYSILGIGDIETSFFNRTSGMANTGIAYRNTNYLTNNNPASLSCLPLQFFVVEGSARGRFINYSGKTITSTNNNGRDFSVEHLAVGTRINKWWGSSVGINPFSISNYAFSGQKSLVGTSNTLPADYDGSGGVNQVYFSNGFNVLKNLYVGINTSMLWGSLTQTESLTSTDLNTSLTTTRNIYLHNLHLTYGLQYSIPVTKKWNLNIGATFASTTSLSADYGLTVITGTDTIKSDVVNKYFHLPNSSGLGISLTKNKNITFVADYRFHQWSSLNYKGANYSLENSDRVSVGFEYSKQNKVQNLIFERYHLQAGIFYSNSYLKIYSEQLKDRGITIGFGVSSKRSSLGYNIALEYGVTGSENNALIKEKYANITFGISYKDFWFTKGKKYD